MTPPQLDGHPGLSPFPPIADYAFLSDCEVTALVAPGGRVEWMCLPRMDGPSIFGALLDRDAGGFRVSPASERVPAGRRYLPKGVAARLHEHETGARLTRREDEILELLEKGLGNRELGQVLGISEDTIKTHLKSLFRKLGVSDRAEAVREGMRRGFIHSQ